jgi:serine/threonine protein kinase
VPILIIEKGPEKGDSHILEPGTVLACGRDAGPHITLTDTMVSRRHFEIHEEKGVYVLHDLKSSNGTFLNDKPVKEPMTLTIGDKIQIGDTIISFLEESKPGKPAGLIGKTVGGYEILDRIGRGGMGTVYKANQISLHREVALKVLSARLLARPDFVERFKHEARSAGRLNHPNIVQVYDVTSAQGLHVFSMEFMEGGSVQDVIGKNGKIPWAEALDMLVDAAQGLVFAEKHEIVHRDIKPDNLMLTTDGRVKIGDLGLATSNAEGTGKDANGSIFGTPHFISPEQAQGQEVGHAADLYSLGATFYRILSGRTPFLGEQVQGIIRQQIVDEPPPLRDLAPDVPQAIAGVIARLMKKNPADRYASATDLLEDLEAIRITHHPASRAGRTRRMAIIVGAIVVVVLGVVGVIVFGHDREVITRTETVNIGGTVDEPRPEDIEQRRQEKAKLHWLELKQTAPALRVTEENYADSRWEALCGKLKSEVVETYEKTDAAAEATAYIKSVSDERKRISDLIKNRDQTLAAHRAALDAMVAAARKAATESLAKKAFALALDGWEKAEGRKEIEADPELKAKTAFNAIRRTILDEARQHHKATEEEVRSLDGSGEMAEALRKLNGFIKTWNPSSRTENVFKAGRGWADRARNDLSSRISVKLSQNLDHDFKQYLSLYGALRKLDGDAQGNQIFLFDFRSAATALRAGLDKQTGLKTWPYQDRLALKIRDLERMAAFIDRFVERINAGKATSMKISLAKGSARAQEGTLQLPFAVDGFKVKVTMGRAETSMPWTLADLRPCQFWHELLQEGKRVALEPRDRLDIALLLAEIGLHEGIAAVLEKLGPLEDLPEALRGDAADVIRRLEPELAAAADWASIGEELAKSGHDAAHLLQRVTAFEGAHSATESQPATDMYLLVGGAPPADPGLISRVMLRKFLADLGQRK